MYPHNFVTEKYPLGNKENRKQTDRQTDRQTMIATVA